VVVAKDRGYFDDMRLNVSIKPGSRRQLPSWPAGRPVELGRVVHRDPQLLEGRAKFVAVADYGKTPIEALLVRGDSPSPRCRI
jgi:hypothetical protein